MTLQLLDTKLSQNFYAKLNFAIFVKILCPTFRLREKNYTNCYIISIINVQTLKKRTAV